MLSHVFGSLLLTAAGLLHAAGLRLQSVDKAIDLALHRLKQQAGT